MIADDANRFLPDKTITNLLRIASFELVTINE